MHVSKASRQRFCSYECQAEWQKTRTGENNPKYAQIDFTCDNCGKVFKDAPYKLSAVKNHFCSTDCRQEWYSNVWSKQEKWRNASRLRAAKLLSKNPITDTAPQRVVNEILCNLGVRYQNEYPVKYYSIDNYLDDYGLAIEVMGDFWHCNRIKYRHISHKTQREAIRRDIAKRTYLLRYHNIHVLYLWEEDITHRRDVVSSLIEMYIKSNGILDNYHSVNYSLNDGALKLDHDIVKMYQDMSAEEREKYITKAAS